MCSLHPELSDPIERRVICYSAVVKINEVYASMQQLVEFLPPSKSPFPLSDVLTKIRQFIRATVMDNFNVTINLLQFEIQIKCTPGHVIEVFIRRMPIVSSGITQNLSGAFADFVQIYSGEWR